MDAKVAPEGTPTTGISRVGLGIAADIPLTGAMGAGRETSSGEQGFARRSVLAAFGVAGGLAVGWAIWPKQYPPNLTAAPGESIFNPWLKIGRDGHVTVIVPQIELGQGAWTVIPQIMADELGADWRTIAVEPAPINQVYANGAIAAEWADGLSPGPDLQMTGEATTVRAYEAAVRRAGAGARALLCMAAAKRWDANWRACDTENGFVVRGQDRLRFGELAEEAATMALPDSLPMRSGNEGRLTGRGVNRLDIPAKLDGSVNFAGDIRLPDMVFASVRQGPPGDSFLVKADTKAGAKIPGVLEIVEEERWIAAVATNWWAANRALDAMHPRFRTEGRLVASGDISRTLQEAFAGEGRRISESGDLAATFAGARLYTAEYETGLTPHAALEPMTATAEVRDGRMQLWIATHWAKVARDAAANAIGMDPDKVTVHATQVGGSFGRKFEVEVAAQVAILAEKVKRPVQLTWSRTEDFWQDRFRPPARAKLAARLARGGKIEGLSIKIAGPDGLGEVRARNLDGEAPGEAQRRLGGKTSAFAVQGAVPPYILPNFALDHYAADIGVPTGQFRGGAHGPSAFFIECFIDELSKISGIEPFSFRMGLLTANPRLALCLSKAAMKGGWQGAEPGSGQGLACHMMRGSHIAVMAEAHMGDDQHVRVTKLVCVADVGRVINPDIARQQIEGGLLMGMGAAIGTQVSLREGLPGPVRLGALGLPRLADMPEIDVELIISKEAPGGISDIAVPPVAPAIANALFSGGGSRFRSLPIGGRAA